jgi:NAD-dependent SIR2 family protein deacetylase
MFGDDLANRLISASYQCPGCRQSFTFEEGANCKRERGIRDNVLVCPKCKSVYEVSFGSGGMILSAKVKLRKARIMLLAIAAIGGWMAGYFIIYQALLSKYTYSIERVSTDRSGRVVTEQVLQFGEREARATAGNATLVLTCAVVAALAVTIGLGIRRGRWLRGGPTTGPAATEDAQRSPSQEA